jgi:C1A family cysteine protease
MPPVLDQGNLGSCTANSISNIHYFDQLKQKDADAFAPSRLFIYYNERSMEGTIGQDSGAEIKDGIKSIAQLGVCPETQLPYDINKFTNKPSESCYQEALNHQAILYQRVDQTLDEMKGCLAEGYPFTIGFTVYDSFESDEVARTGIVPMPKPNESVLGGHAVTVCGYDDATERFWVQNSWGTKWGILGFFSIPYAYFTNNNMADDLWTVRMVEDSQTPPTPPPPTPTPVTEPWWKKIFDWIF